MINGKQRAFLKKMAHGMEDQILIGKSGMSENLIKQIDVTLEKRELVKIKILNNNSDDREELISEILELTGAEFVQEMGNKLIIYRKNEEEPVIDMKKLH